MVNIVILYSMHFLSFVRVSIVMIGSEIFGIGVRVTNCEFFEAERWDLGEGTEIGTGIRIEMMYQIKIFRRNLRVLI